jgi:hypothetical protein
MKIGGKVIGSGGFGCVFRPALKCRGKTRTAKKMISKLMSVKHAKTEYEEIQTFKKLLNTIPNYNRYFLLNDITICKPDTLTNEDLQNFNNNCSALTDDYSSDTINSALDKELQTLNMPDGGMDLQDYMKTIDYKDLPRINNMLIDLLVNGIIKMNKKKVLHADLKNSNILMDGRIIDWGLSTTYTLSEIPSKLKNRTVYYNSPFSNILFNNIFDSMYSQFLSATPNPSYSTTRIFVEQYIQKWFDYRGRGHYNLIKRFFKCLFVDSVSTNPNEIAMDFIIDYITTVLTEYTKNGKINLLKYFTEVYVLIIDVYGFITVYLYILELLADNYTKLNQSELKLYEAIKALALTHLFEPRVSPNNMKVLVSDLKALNKLFINCVSDASSYSSYVNNSSSFNSQKPIEEKSLPLTKIQSRKLARSLYKSKNRQVSRRRRRRSQ